MAELLLPFDHRTPWDRLERLEDLAHLATGSRPSLWHWEAERVERVKAGLAPKLPEPPGDEHTDGAPVRAVVNHGRWIAQCHRCGYAQHISLEDNRFWCLECRPDEWSLVLYPPVLDIVERILQVRPVEARNWHPDEEWEDLVRENHEHGLPGMAGQPS